MSKKKRTITTPGHKKPSQSHKGRLRTFKINGGLPDPQTIREELRGYREILLGREDPPSSLEKVGIHALQEFADACFARTCELEQNILEAIAEGHLDKDSPYHSLRTQELRSYKEMFKASSELGSRRLTREQIRVQQEMRGLESM